jgi:hypothetical protein
VFKLKAAFLLIFLMTQVPAANAQQVANLAQQVSALFGASGEHWNPDDPSEKLPDFRFAGYRMGQVHLPDTSTRTKLDVRNYGARINDGIDDSAAIVAAIKAAAGKGHVVYFPNGTYELDRQVSISNLGNFVLRGQSRDGVILKVDRGICEVRNNCATTREHSTRYGFIQVIGSSYLTSANLITTVTANAARNSRNLVLASAAKIAVGDTITLTLTDTSVRTLQRHLHGDVAKPNIAQLNGQKVVVFTSRVTAKSGNAVTLERRIPVRVDTTWSPQIYRFAPNVREVGVENLTVQMKATTYLGHLKEKGFNGVHFDHVANSWVRNVKVLNADFGIDVRSSQFVTVDNVVVDSSARTAGDYNGQKVKGHHALNALFGGDHLFSRFSVPAAFAHDLTVEGVRGAVFENGSGGNLSLDHHGLIPLQNLFTQLDAGAGTRLYFSGGATERLPHAAASNVYWNIRAANARSMPCSYVAGQSMFVAVPGYNGNCTSYRWHNEKVPQAYVSPQNLYEAQKALSK